MNDDSLSDEDKALFLEHMRSVTPLNTKNKKIQNKTPIALPKSITLKKEPKPKKERFLSDFIQESVDAPTILSYCDSSLPAKRFQSLKKGSIRWDARLDLHGLNTETAREALLNFIQNQTQARCVLIIHGKGNHQGTAPVLKNLVNRWLPQLREVLAFHSAQPKDGGQGAVYVLLKNRNKD